MKVLRVIGYVCLFLMTIYTIVFSESKNFDWFVVACWGGVFYYWWLEDRDAARSERKSGSKNSPRGSPILNGRQGSLSIR